MLYKLNVFLLLVL